MIRLKKYSINNEKLDIKGTSARVINEGTISINTLANLCADINTLTRADTLAVIEALLTEIINCLEQGYSVSLGDIGSLHLTMKGKSASNANLWNISNNVTRVNVRYTPSSAIREKIALGAEGIRTRIID